MNDEMIDSIIHDRAAKVIERIKGGMLYGRPIDIQNLDQVIYAAYLTGELDASPPIISREAAPSLYPGGGAGGLL